MKSALHICIVLEVRCILKTLCRMPKLTYVLTQKDPCVAYVIRCVHRKCVTAANVWTMRIIIAFEENISNKRIGKTHNSVIFSNFSPYNFQQLD